MNMVETQPRQAKAMHSQTLLLSFYLWTVSGHVSRIMTKVAEWGILAFVLHVSFLLAPHPGNPSPFLSSISLHILATTPVNGCPSSTLEIPCYWPKICTSCETGLT
jgi:hypothetical protein